MEQSLNTFASWLHEQEKSPLTIEKYVRDVRHFQSWANGRELSKELCLEWKAWLEKHYATASANSMIAALNCWLRWMERQDCLIRQFKVQKRIYCDQSSELTKEEYFLLIETARSQNREDLALIMETLGSTGIRVSELEYITADCLASGRVEISCKNKKRVIFIPTILSVKLRNWARTKHIEHGPLFKTASGNPYNRCNIWRMLKNLAKKSKVDPVKVHPHNFRHLFARTFYEQEKDLAQLADLLGHSSINTTRIYIISTGQEHRRKLDSLGLVF